MYSYALDLVIWSSVLCVNITQIDQCNSIGEKKVNGNNLNKESNQMPSCVLSKKNSKFKVLKLNQPKV